MYSILMQDAIFLMRLGIYLLGVENFVAQGLCKICANFVQDLCIRILRVNQVCPRASEKYVDLVKFCVGWADLHYFFDVLHFWRRFFVNIFLFYE